MEIQLSKSSKATTTMTFTRDVSRDFRCDAEVCSKCAADAHAEIIRLYDTTDEIHK
ncbi:MAG TPA: hypothetical protein VF393_07560 [archaeon]